MVDTKAKTEGKSSHMVDTKAESSSGKLKEAADTVVKYLNQYYKEGRFTSKVKISDVY